MAQHQNKLQYVATHSIGKNN